MENILTLYVQYILLQDATQPPIYFHSLQIVSILDILSETMQTVTRIQRWEREFPPTSLLHDVVRRGSRGANVLEIPSRCCHCILSKQLLMIERMIRCHPHNVYFFASPSWSSSRRRPVVSSSFPFLEMLAAKTFYIHNFSTDSDIFSSTCRQQNPLRNKSPLPFSPERPSTLIAGLHSIVFDSIALISPGAFPT